MQIIKPLLDCLVAVAIGVSHNPSSTIVPESNPTLEKRTHSWSVPPQYCSNYEFDGSCTQRQLGDKCVTYYTREEYKVIAILEKGILTSISNDPEEEIERFKVRFLQEGSSPCKDLFDPKEEIEVSPEEEDSLRKLFLYYKRLLLNQ